MTIEKEKDIDVNSIAIKVYCDNGCEIAAGRYNKATNWAHINTHDDDQALEDEIVEKIESGSLKIHHFDRFEEDGDLEVGNYTVKAECFPARPIIY